MMCKKFPDKGARRSASRIMRAARISFPILSPALWMWLLLLVPGIASAAPPLPEGESDLENSGVHQINFGRDSRVGSFVTSHELSVWGAGRNLSLVPDCPDRGIQDSEAVVIPQSGIRFHLDAIAENRRNFLYLDLVTFRPSRLFDREQASGYCRASPGQITFPGVTGYDLPNVNWLEVIVNGRVLKRLYLGGGAFIQSPVVVLVERENAPDGKLNVFLRPSTGDGFFAIWDAFVSAQGVIQEEDQE